MPPIPDPAGAHDRGVPPPREKPLVSEFLHDPFDVDEDVAASIGFMPFKPAEHGTCDRAIILGPNDAANARCAAALRASRVFPRPVETYTDPTELPGRMNHDNEIVVLLLHGFRSNERVALYLAIGSALSWRNYADFSMVYTGATDRGASAWAIVFERCEGGEFPFYCKWYYRYAIPPESEEDQ